MTCLTDAEMVALASQLADAAFWPVLIGWGIGAGLGVLVGRLWPRG